MRYLFDPKSLPAREDCVDFRMLSKPKLIDVATKLLDRLYPLLQVDGQDVEPKNEDEKVVICPTTPTSKNALQEKLKCCNSKCQTTCETV